MKHIILTFLILSGYIFSQSIYFPPNTGNQWESISPSSLGWCVDRIDSLYNYLEQQNSKAFLVLKNGKIVLEKYFGSFSKDSIWYWASAGKTLTAFLVGIAQQEGYLSIDDSTSKFLGVGWTTLPTEKEKLIKIRHQLTMTSGLRDFVSDPHCTLPSCLIYQADAGTRWAYHNAPYTLLEKVVVNATGQNYNIYFNNKIRSKIGMGGVWLQSGFNNVYYSNARSMARFGILIQNRAVWNNDTLLKNTQYFNAMVNTSQQFNKSYGYLWWLAGKESYMLPQTQIVFNGSWVPNAPADMIAALGKDGQILNIVPSLGLVIVRMGQAPDSSGQITPHLNNEIWKKLNQIICNQTKVEDENISLSGFYLHQNHPNPFNPSTVISWQSPINAHQTLKVYDVLGREVATLVDEYKSAGRYEINFDGNILSSGVYYYQIRAGDFISTKKMVLLR